MELIPTSSLSPAPVRLGLGCVTFGREIEAATAHTMMDFAVRQQWAMFDTAAAYGGGASERIVGEWLHRLAPTAPRPLLATKLLPPYDAETLTAGVRTSLQRLQIPCVDVLYLHQWHDSVLQPAVLAALQSTVEQGLVGALGASNFSAEQLERVLTLQTRHGAARFRYLQNIHNYAVSAFDPVVGALCRREGVERVGYSPLGAGFLSGKYQRGVPAGTRFDLIPGHQKIYFTPSAQQRMARLLAVAEQTGCSPIDLAYAWALRPPAVSLMLVGGRSSAQLEQAIAAPARVPTEAIQLLESDSGPVQKQIPVHL